MDGPEEAGGHGTGSDQVGLLFAGERLGAALRCWMVIYLSICSHTQTERQDVTEFVVVVRSEKTSSGERQRYMCLPKFHGALNNGNSEAGKKNFCRIVR